MLRQHVPSFSFELSALDTHCRLKSSPSSWVAGLVARLVGLVAYANCHMSEEVQFVAAGVAGAAAAVAVAVVGEVEAAAVGAAAGRMATASIACRIADNTGLVGMAPGSF